MYKKYDTLVERVTRFGHSIKKEPIANVFAPLGIDDVVMATVQPKLEELKELVGRREILQAERKNALTARNRFEKHMNAEVTGLARSIKAAFPLEAEHEKFGFVTRYINQEVPVSAPAEAGKAQGDEVPETPVEVTLVRRPRTQRKSLTAIMGRQRQIAMAIAQITEEARLILAEAGWPEARLLKVQNFGAEFERLCRIVEDLDLKARTMGRLVATNHRRVLIWYRGMAQTARNLAEAHPHLAPELLRMGEI